MDVAGPECTARWVHLLPETAPEAAIALQAGQTAAAIFGSLGAAGQVWFVWGTTSTALNSSTAKASLPASAAAQAVSVQLTGLTSKKTYYFQPVASAVGGTPYGAIQSFT